MTVCQLKNLWCMMKDWERARTLEQKESREREILEAAKDLLLQKSYESIRFSDFAEKVSFSRANIYKYFESKEEVYLALLADEIQRFAHRIEDLLIPTASTPSLLKQEFCELWSVQLVGEKILLLLLSMAGTILEKNCSDSVLLQSKESMYYAMQEKLIPSLMKFFPFLNPSELANLITNLVILANGLFSLCGLNESQKTLLNQNGLGAMIYDFQKDYGLLVKQLIDGVYWEEE